jgi:transposase
MAAIDELKQDVAAGRIDVDRLAELVAAQQRKLQGFENELQATKSELQAAKQRIKELEKQLGDAKPAKVDQAYSLRAEEKRQQARGKKRRKLTCKGRRGRLNSIDKIKLAERTDQVFPDGVPKSDCKLSHTRPVWRLEEGRAVLIAYEIYRGPGNRFGKIPGALGRCEFGVEIVLEVAYLIYVMGLSFDKACAVLKFFQNVHLRKAQADALLHQLARHWENEFEVLCTLLANSLVVNTDETSWSLNSVWAFLSEKARVLLFGVPKDAATLGKILDPATFAGLVISDDAAVYANFTAAQKCWAHLLRKAIKLTLTAPQNQEYRVLTDRLLEIYRKACRLQQDGRLSDAGRRRKVAALDDEILELCVAGWVAELPPLQGVENDYRLLVNEIMRLMLARQLFTFVSTPPALQPNGESKPAGGTNNESERTLRNSAQARTTGRTNKTIVGARRQTIIVSVLESLRLYLPDFTLTTVSEEIKNWYKAGRSCFTKLLKKMKLAIPNKSILAEVIPLPDG